MAGTSPAMTLKSRAARSKRELLKASNLSHRCSQAFRAPERTLGKALDVGAGVSRVKRQAEPGAARVRSGRARPNDNAVVLDSDHPRRHRYQHTVPVDFQRLKDVLKAFRQPAASALQTTPL
jgi:hypothetical protein